MTLDPQEYAKRRIAENRPEFAFDPVGFPDFAAWQVEFRSRLAGVLGIEGWERVPLNAQVGEREQMDEYTREYVTFQTRDGVTACGYFLFPDNPVAQPCPAVLCLPGHGRGVDSIIGIAEDGTQRELRDFAEYAKDFALQAVFYGYAVFALEQISFGKRRDEKARNEGLGASSCKRDAMAALMLGETLIGWRVWDAMRALDYLLSRPEVEPSRLITMGISGGGMTSLFTAALDERVWACAVSGYLNTFADSVLAIDHCVDNYAPGLLELCEMSDIAGLIAPRPLCAESGRNDPIFPVAAFRQTCQRVKQIYAYAGDEHRFGYETFDGGHEFYGEEMWMFLG